MLQNRSASLTVVANQTLLAAQVKGASIFSVTMMPSADANAGVLPSATYNYSAAVYIDATYEGDLLASVGVSTTWGREANTTYNESFGGRLAEPNPVGGHQFRTPLNYTDAASGALLPMIYGGDPGTPGAADTKVQAFNFRMCLTTDAAKRAPIGKPDNYDPAYWELLRRYLAVLQPTSIRALMNIGALPFNTSDVNNNGPISTDFIGGSWEWPTASPAQRMALWGAHKDYTQGFFYFLGHDPSVPSSVQQEMLEWGLDSREFMDNGFWPWQLYVREGRRMVSDFVFTQSDRMDPTQLSKPDSIGLFSYNIDTHHAQRIPQGDYVLNDGDVEQGASVGVGQMPYRMILPRRSEAVNLLAPVSCSASHIGYGAIRLEPQFMILGQSAGVAAAMAAQRGIAVQDVDVLALQARLRALGQRIDI